MRTALVGYGMAGRIFHAPLIRSTEGLELATIVQRRGDDASSAYPEVRIERAFDRVLADTSIGLIVIATPNASHFDLTRAALEAGKHVVVDKPVTVGSTEAARLIAIAAERSRLLSVFHNRRWDGDFLTVKQLVERGALGRIVELTSRFDRYRPAPREGAWRESSEPGSGVLYDLGVHLIDQALVLFGVPRAVTAHVRVERERAIADDAFDLALDYSRFRVSLGAGMLVRERSPRFVVRGTDATYVKFDLDPQESALKEGRTPGGPGWVREARSSWGELISEPGRGEAIETIAGNYRAFYENVRDAIGGRASLEVRPVQARTAIEIIEAAQTSSREKRAVMLG